MKRQFLIAGAAVLLLCVAQVAPAATVTWTGGGADTLWTTVDNWSGGILPASGDSIIFAGGTTATLTGAINVGTLTFNVDSDFSITGTQKITFTGMDAPIGGHTYSLALSGIGFNAGASTINVAGGSNLIIQHPTANWNPSFYSLTKTGTGYVQFYPNMYGTEGFGRMDVQAGSVGLTEQGTEYYRIGSLSIAEGASVFPTAALTLELNNVGRGVNDIRGTLGSSTLTLTLGQGDGWGWGSTVKLSGQGRIDNFTWQYLRGDLILDNSEVLIADRFVNKNVYPYLYAGVKLIGHGTTETNVEPFLAASPAGLNGRLNAEVQHGENANAMLTLPNLSLSWGDKAGIILFSGNDLNGTGTYVSKIKLKTTVFATGNGSNAGKASGLAFFGMEFAARDASGYAVAYDGTGRVNDLTTSTVSQNVLINGAMAAALAADALANTLKIDGGYGIDLGGKILQLGSANGGGLIQTGSANTAGITNGTIRGGATGVIPVIVVNDQDLTIGAAVMGNVFMKDGPGKLTLTGTVSGGAESKFRWYNGSLVLDSPTNISLQQYTVGEGTLVKKGANTLTLPTTYYNMSTGDFTAEGGTVVVKGDGLGYGTATFKPGTTMTVSDGKARMRDVVIENAQMNYSTGWTREDWKLTIPAGTTAVINSTNTTYSGYDNALKLRTLVGSGTMRLIGTGRALLTTQSGASSFTGNIGIEAGTLHISSLGEPGDNHIPAGVTNLAFSPTAKMWIGSDALETGHTYDFTSGGKVVISYYEDASYATGRDFTSAGGTWKIGAKTLTLSGTVDLINGQIDAMHFAQTGTGQMAKLQLDVVGSGAVAGADYGQLAGSSLYVTGFDSLDLVVTVAAGLDLAGDILTIITSYNDLTGLAFNSITVNGGAMLADPAFGAGFVSLSNFRNAIIQKMGDADGDTFVDDDDLSLLLSNWKGGDVGWGKGDFNGSHDVDDDDLSLLLSNWTGSGGGTIPEPATIGLLILGGLGLISRKRRHQA